MGVVFVVVGAVGLLLPNRGHTGPGGPIWIAALVLLVVGIVLIVMNLKARSRRQ